MTAIRMLAAALLAMPTWAAGVEYDFSGNIGVETRKFFQSPLFPSQPDSNVSVAIRPELYASWDDGQQSLLFIPFFRYDQHDARRTHGDIRDLSYIFAGDAFEVRAGIRRVFWGVTESNHLVDIINQTDFVENFDFEQKFGQPMVNLALIRDWGTLDLFVLPGFRERSFAGRNGRFQAPLRIDTSDARYESAARDGHVDWAARYSHYFGPVDAGLYHFWGTSREPRFEVVRSRVGELVLVPNYDIIHQTGTDVQVTLGSWLLKLEALRRQGQGKTFAAAVGGFEYTFFGVFGSAFDVGALAELHYDSRGRNAPLPFNKDVFVGTRIAANDAADSQILGGILSDLDGNGHFFNIEASRRFGTHWKVEIEFRLLLDVDPRDALFGFSRDDHIQIEILRYF